MSSLPLLDQVTLHLTPEDVWDAQKTQPHYLPEAFPQDGFIHCTNGEDELIAVGNRYYQADKRPFIVLTVSLPRLQSAVTVEDPGRIFPHIHGPLNLDAVVAVRPVVRAADGAFIAIGT